MLLTAVILIASFIMPLSKIATDEAARAAQLELAYRACMGPRLPVVW
jgi:hypothetical protein